MVNNLSKSKQNAIINNNRFAESVDQNVFGEKVGIIGKIFGCGHRNISRPFSQSKIAYRSCLQCGARKQFDPVTLETFGGFYYPPIITAETEISLPLEK